LYDTEHGLFPHLTQRGKKVLAALSHHLYHLKLTPPPLPGIKTFDAPFALAIPPSFWQTASKNRTKTICHRHCHDLLKQLPVFSSGLKLTILLRLRSERRRTDEQLVQVDVVVRHQDHEDMDSIEVMSCKLMSDA
jgi:hypothetical protein